MLRRILARELEAMRVGKPTKEWHPIEQASTLFQYKEAEEAV